MLRPLIRGLRDSAQPRPQERGFTMALVAVALATIIVMAALSIDIGTLYQAKAEAQRAADASALTAARMISISGITGDPTNSSGDWTDVCSLGGSATLAAVNVAQQNLISGVAAPTITVNYGIGSAGASSTSCVLLGSGFGLNPVVTVTLTSANLPIFFSPILSFFSSTHSSFSNTTVSATATAE